MDYRTLSMQRCGSQRNTPCVRRFVTGGAVDDVGAGGVIGLELLGVFRIHCDGATVTLPVAAQRVTALVALSAHGIHRAGAAETLWPDSARRRAAANLRSALWHVRRRIGPAVLPAGSARLRLDPSVRVDVVELADRVRTRRVRADGAELPARLARRLLDDWPDAWLAPERLRWDQVRLHALEQLAAEQLAAGRHLAALEAAMTAVAVEPMRESAYRLVAQVLIDEGNPACAVRHYQRFRSLVQRELGVVPSRQMTRLIAPLVSG